MLMVLFSLQAFSAPAKQVQLTDEEKIWITQHPVVNFTGDPDWLPFEGFTGNGQYIGIISEILKIIEQQTPLKFNVIPAKSWSESISLLKSGKVDMMTVSDAWKDPEYLYTKSILANPIVIVMKSDHSYVDSLYYLQYESIAVIKGYHYVDSIKKKYPEYNYYEVDNIQEGLKGVASGKYDALLASMALATYTLDNMQINNVKVVGETEFEIKVNFAVRKEFAPLAGIINKVTIGEKKKHELLKEWTYQKYVEKTDYTLITQLFMFLLIILMAAVILYLLLKKKSQKHKNAESLLSNIQEEINNAVKYASVLDGPSGLKSDELRIFSDDSFIVSYPENSKSSTFAYFARLDHDKMLLMVIDAGGKGIDSILKALFIKTLIEAAVDQVSNQSLEADPANILSALEMQIRRAIDKIDPNDKPDNTGFDAAVVTIDKADHSLMYAGANIPLLYTKNHEVFTVRANKHSVGSGSHDYTKHSIRIVDTMDFYLFSNGYTEQAGGRQNLPFGKRRVKEILGKYENYNMDTQKNALLKDFREYAGENETVRDITLLGFRISGQQSREPLI